MKMLAKQLLTAALLLVPLSALTEGELTRAEGFALLWEGIRRPIEETATASFEDTLSHPRRELLHYALSRKILEEHPYFNPDAPLTLEQALIWLLRTRNLDHPDDIVPATLPQFLRYYQLSLPTSLSDSRAITRNEFVSLITELEEFLVGEVHVASFYSDEFAGEYTAFGEVFNPGELTAAHRFLPPNTLLRVTDVDSGNSVTVRVNDRGPYVEGRTLDLSRAAFEALAPLSRGTLRVRIERLGDPSLIFSCGSPYQRRIGGNFVLTPGFPHVRQVGKPLIIRANYGFSLTNITLPDGTALRNSGWIGRLQPYRFTLDQPGVYTFTIHTGSERERTFTVRAVEKCHPSTPLGVTLSSWSKGQEEDSRELAFQP